VHKLNNLSQNVGDYKSKDGNARPNDIRSG